MITIDTNILSRVFVKDDAKQWEIVARLMTSDCIVVLPTVLMETEWVLRSVARYSPSKILGLFRGLLLADNIVIINHIRVLRTLDAYEAGFDFADAFHLFSNVPNATFVTFDRDLVRRATKHLPEASVQLAG